MCLGSVQGKALVALIMVEHPVSLMEPGREESGGTPCSTRVGAVTVKMASIVLQHPRHNDLVLDAADNGVLGG